MKIALLGADPAAISLVEAAIAQPENRLVAVADIEANFPLPGSLAGANVVDWETLVDNPAIDTVIVTGSPDRERRADQLRKLVQSGLSLLIVHPVCESLVGHELEMIRRDTGAALTPYVPGARHPALGELAAMFTLPPVEVAGQPDQPKSESATPLLGELEQLLFTRRLKDRSPAAVTNQLAKDLLLLQALVGELNGISAMGPVHGATSFANLSVHLSGRHPVLVRWSIEPAEGETSAELVAIGTAGKATLEITSDLHRWRLRQESASGAGERIIPAPHEAAETLAELSGKPSSSQEIRWSAACRAQELAEAVPESLRRSRTITLHYDEHTEEGTFKGIMAVGGCAILMIVFLVTILAAVVDGLQLPIGAVNNLLRAAPLCLLVPLVIFLLVQLLIVAPISKPKE